MTSDEIGYELALRHIVNLGSMTRRIMVQHLRNAVEEDNSRGVTPDSSEHVMSATANLEACQTSLRELHQQTYATLRNGTMEGLSQLRSRIEHYRNRLAIIKPPGFLVDAHSSLSRQTEMMWSDINSALDPESGAAEASKRGSNRSNSKNGVSVNPTTNRNGTPKSPTTSSPVPLGRNGGINWSDLSGTRRNQRDMEGDASHGSRYTPPPLWIPFAGAADNHNQTDPADPSNRFHGDGRGYGTRNERRQCGGNQQHDQQNQFSTNHRCNRVQEEYNSLQHDLLRYLLRQDQARSAARGEDRRMLKAVHNWPFKFRGEKDTTSLNIFLDRVETFARSEGMDDNTLLTSIKHLLQEDALDWYARAMTQNQLVSWEAFKTEIRSEFLPREYAQILRVEAYFRFQGQNEPFSKFYRDITALFRFVSPPMGEQDKLFVVKKNMNADYAVLVAAARPRSLQEMVEVCTSYDETKLLHTKQRRMPIPHSTLLEPNLATPAAPQRPPAAAFPQQRFSRVHALELDEGATEIGDTDRDYSRVESQDQKNDEEQWQLRMDNLMEQVNAMQMQFRGRHTKPNQGERSQMHTAKLSQRQPTLAHAEGQQIPQSDLSSASRREIQPAHPSYAPAAQPHRIQQQTHHPAEVQRQTSVPPAARQGQQQEGEQQANHRRQAMSCWNCDDEGHRFMDCPKPQAVLFCYRCGRKGYSLRSCFTCRTDAGNAPAENQQ